MFSVLLLVLSFNSLALSSINDIALDTMIPSKGFEVKSEMKPMIGSSIQYNISNAGDIDKDGYEDIIIGDFSYGGNKGMVYVIYGNAQAAPHTSFNFADAPLNPSAGFKITGAASNEYFGFSVSTAGDVNKDGHADIIIGAFGKGVAYVLYGGSRAFLQDIDLSIGFTSTRGFIIRGESNSDQFGYSVSSAGDFDKDGYVDVIVGAPMRMGGKGAAYVFYGGPSLADINLSITPLNPLRTGFMISGETAGDALGTVISSAGDIDGDTHGDIMIAAPLKDSHSLVDNGAVYVIYGTQRSSTLGFDLSNVPLIPTSTGFTVTGSYYNDVLGYSISAAGHINNDRFADIIIGAPSLNSNQGAAYVLLGNDRNALADIILGSGEARILSKENNPKRVLTSVLPPSQGFVIFGEGSSTENFASSVNSAGDVNGDGFDDIIIGATGGYSTPGKVYVLYGGATLTDLYLANTNLPQANIGYSISGNAAGGGFGSSVGSMTGFSDNKKMRLVVSEMLLNPPQITSYILFPSALCAGEHCEFCNLPDTCSICSRGYWANTALAAISGDICQECPEGCTRCTSDRTCQGCEIGYTQAKTNTLCTLVSSSEPPFYGNSRENATKDVFDGTSIVGAALSSGSSLPINFGLVAKILRNVKYLNVTVSPELQETFFSWKVNSGFLAAPKSWAMKAESKPLPGVFSRYGLAPAFLVNYWKPFLLTIIGLAIFAVFKGIEIVVYKGDKETLKSSIPRQLNLAASNFALTQVYSNLDDVVLYFILDARSTKVDGGFGAFSLILAVTLLLVGGVIIGVHIVLLRKYQALKGGEKQPATLKTDSPPTQLQRFCYKYENMKLIFNDFKDVSFFTQSFLWVHLTRALLSSFIFAIMFEYPLAQLIILLLLNIGMIVLLFMKRSFKDLLGTLSQLFCETVLLIANICMLGLAIMDQSESYNLEAMRNLSRAVIVLNAILLIGCAILMIIGVLKSLYESYIAKKKAAPVGLKDLPHIQNNRLNSEKFRVDKSQLGILSTGNYTGHYDDTQDFPAEAVNNAGGNYYGTEGTNNNTIEVFDLNPNNQNNNMMTNKGNFLDSNASFSYQADDLANTSNLNLLSNNNNSVVRAESLRRPRRRINIKMPGGFQTNPKSNFETPTMTGQLQSPHENNYGSEFSPQRARPQGRYANQGGGY